MEYQHNEETGEELKIFKTDDFTIHADFKKGNQHIRFSRLGIEIPVACTLKFDSENEAKIFFDGITKDLHAIASWNALNILDEDKIEL